MCTIGIALHAHPDWPLIIAANRDELYARDAIGPVVLRASGPRVVGGLDHVSGGTWMGLNDAGIFVGVTNQRTFVGPDRSLASRGPMVVDALTHTTMGSMRDYVAGLDPRAFNEFNLLYGNANQLEVAYARRDAERMRIEAVPKGFHALPNDELNHPWFPKATRLAGDLSKSLDSAPVDLGQLGALLGTHDKPALDTIEELPAASRFDRPMVRELMALCIHTPAYGTRSATVVGLAGDGRICYLFADGPPCRTEFTDFSHLLTGSPPPSS